MENPQKVPISQPPTPPPKLGGIKIAPHKCTDEAKRGGGRGGGGGGGIERRKKRQMKTKRKRNKRRRRRRSRSRRRRWWWRSRRRKRGVDQRQGSGGGGTSMGSFRRQAEDTWGKAIRRASLPTVSVASSRTHCSLRSLRACLIRLLSRYGDVTNMPSASPAHQRFARPHRSHPAPNSCSGHYGLIVRSILCVSCVSCVLSCVLVCLAIAAVPCFYLLVYDYRDGWEGG
jgi:hypothetical protein